MNLSVFAAALLEMFFTVFSPYYLDASTSNSVVMKLEFNCIFATWHIIDKRIISVLVYGSECWCLKKEDNEESSVLKWLG